jgi:hypothetical protein
MLKAIAAGLMFAAYSPQPLDMELRSIHIECDKAAQCTVSAEDLIWLIKQHQNMVPEIQRCRGARDV